jgi:hypothetical protein
MNWTRYLALSSAAAGVVLLALFFLTDWPVGDADLPVGRCTTNATLLRDFKVHNRPAQRQHGAVRVVTSASVERLPPGVRCRNQYGSYFSPATVGNWLGLFARSIGYGLLIAVGLYGGWLVVTRIRNHGGLPGIH